MKVFGHHVYAPFAFLAVAEFGIAAGAFLATDFVLALITGTTPASIGIAQIVPALSFAAAVVLGLTAVGLFQIKQRLSIEGVLARIVVGLAFAAIGLALVSFFLRTGFGGGVWTVSLVLTGVLLGVSRVSLWRWLDHERFQRRVLVFGAGKQAASLLKLRRRSDRRGFNVVAFVAAPGDERALDDPRVVQSPGPLPAYAEAHDVDEIVMAMDDRRRGFPISELLSCKLAGVRVTELLPFLERETGRVNVDLVNPSWLIFSDGFGASVRVHVATRIVDLVVSLVLFTVAMPFMLLVAIAIALDDGLPVLYRQARVGKGGRRFTLYKFRSMVRDAETEGRPEWAKPGDTRVTRIGGTLRKLRLDELPQLYNVINGDMSLVGPRPERPEFVEQLSREIPYYEERHIVKPGITGWAQLSYPYGASEHDATEKLQYDLYYIKNKSLVFDLMVLLQTAEVVLWGKGAR